MEPTPDEPAISVKKDTYTKTGKTKFFDAFVWDDTYFYIPQFGRWTGIRIHIHGGWQRAHPAGLGTDMRSKFLTPSHYGENLEHPQRTFILLRAWAHWRASQKNWVQLKDGRKRHFDEQYQSLIKDIKEMQPQKGGLLGNTKADELLTTWLPNVKCQM